MVHLVSAWRGQDRNIGGCEKRTTVPAFWSPACWPLPICGTDIHGVGLMALITHSDELHGQAVAMIEAVLISSLHHQEVTQGADR